MAFFKMNQKEIDHKVKEIELKYQECISLYGEQYFDLAGYKKRYLSVLSEKGNMEVFINSELMLINNLQETMESKKKQYMETKKTLTDNIDKMTNHIINQLSAYPEADLGDRASLEIKKLVGACRIIYPKIEPFKSFVSVNNHSIFFQCLNDVKDLISEPYSPAYKNYLDIIKNPLISISKAEIFVQKILKTIGVALTTIIEIINRSPYKNDFRVTVDYLKTVLKDFRLDIFEPKHINDN